MFGMAFDHTIIDNAVDYVRRRFRTCVLAKDGHFEQLLLLNFL